MSINARTEDDIDEKAVKERVSKASGANYGFHKEAKKPLPAVEPVVSVFQLPSFFAIHICRTSNSVCSVLDHVV